MATKGLAECLRKRPLVVAGVGWYAIYSLCVWVLWKIGGHDSFPYWLGKPLQEAEDLWPHSLAMMLSSFFEPRSAASELVVHGAGFVSVVGALEWAERSFGDSLPHGIRLHLLACWMWLVPVTALHIVVWMVLGAFGVHMGE